MPSASSSARSRSRSIAPAERFRRRLAETASLTELSASHLAPFDAALAALIAAVDAREVAARSLADAYTREVSEREDFCALYAQTGRLVQNHFPRDREHAGALLRSHLRRASSRGGRRRSLGYGVSPASEPDLAAHKRSEHGSKHRGGPQGAKSESAV